MITGGKVIFGRTVQPQQFESKRAEVEIMFSVPEGADASAGLAMLNEAASLAQAKALELVGLKQSTPAPVGATVSKTVAEVTDKKADKAPTKTKADLEAEQKAALEAKAAAKDKADATAENEAKIKAALKQAAADAAAIVDDKPQISTNPEDRKDPAVVEDPAAITDESLFTADDTPVTDADLRTHIMKVNEKLKNGPAIRQLIGKYVKPGQGAAEIPMDKRKAFLTELDAL